MKKLNIILIIVIILYSCITNNRGSIEYKYEIVNNSGKDIKIIGFDRTLNDSRTVTSILNSETYSKSFISSVMGPGFFFSDVLGGDPIKIIFDNTKFKTFKCYRNQLDEGCKEERNILHIFENVGNVDGIILNRFTFEPIDYENAEDCNGNCD